MAVKLSPKAEEIVRMFKEFCWKIGGRAKREKSLAPAYELYVCTLPNPVEASIATRMDPDTGKWSARIRVEKGIKVEILDLKDLDEIVWFVDNPITISEKNYNPRLYEEGRVTRFPWDRSATGKDITVIKLGISTSGNFALVSLEETEK